MTSILNLAAMHSLWTLRLHFGSLAMGRLYWIVDTEAYSCRVAVRNETL